MKTLRRPLSSALLLLVLGAGLLPSAAAASQDAPNRPATEAVAAKPAAQEAAAEVRPPVLTPKEKTGVYVFLAWTWMSIAVLLYILTLKVREADRVLRTGFFGTPGGKEAGKPR